MKSVSFISRSGNRPWLHALTVCFLLAIACIWAAAFRAAADETDALTLMVYMCGSNLESKGGAASRDLMEMAASGYDETAVNVLVMTGGSKRWALNVPKDTLCIYTPGADSLSMLESFESRSMGDPASLKALLDYGYTHYPAKKYALILWNHGGGPLNGVCLDELYQSDTLTMEELVAALAQSPASSEALEWIGFDACLMGSAEVASLLSPFAHYMIASEETEPGGGWDYAFLQDIEADASGADTGHRIIDGYFASSQDGFDLTLSCLDLTRLSSLTDALDHLFEPLEIGSGNYALFSYAAGTTRAFGKAAGSAYSYDLIDLAALIDTISAQQPQQAKAAADALADVVTYTKSTRDAGGLSVYHPYENKEDYALTWNTLYPQLGFSQGYTDYISRFAGFLFGSSTINWGNLSALPTSEPGIYALPLSKEQQSMLQSALFHVLRWEDAEQAYADVCTQGELSYEDGILYGAFAGQTLSAISKDETILAQSIPYEVLSDGRIGISVNFCTPQGRLSPEASLLIHADLSGAKKDFGSYSFDTENLTDAQTSSLGEQVSSGTLTVTHISPLSSEVLETLSVPENVSLAMKGGPSSLVSTYASSFRLQDGAEVDITPVSTQDLGQGETGTITIASAGSRITVDDLSPVGTASFPESQVSIDLSGVDLDQEDKTTAERPDVVHACLVYTAMPDDRLTLSETWIYDEESDQWSTRSRLDLSDYPAAFLPVAMRTPAFHADALTGLETWEIAGTTAYELPSEGWSLQFLDEAETDHLCISFEITDVQSNTWCSLPLKISIE